MVNWMKVTMLGTSGGILIPGRAQSGILIETSEEKILLDCGMGIPLRLSEAGVKAEEIDIICITHGHLDHIQDLPSLTKASWLSSRKAEYKIITPPNLKNKLVSFWKILDEYERTELKFEVLRSEESYKDEIEISAFKTEHTSISQGYEICKGKKKVVYTGDTAPCESVKENAEGADVLIHELSYIEKKTNHTNPEGLISKLNGADVNELVITHFYPSASESAKELASDIQRKTGIKTTAGEDFQSFTI